MDNDTRRQKQQALITELLERKIRMHAQQIYDKRGQTEGLALQDWAQAESEVLGKSILAPLYRKTKAEGRSSVEFPEGAGSQFASANSSASEPGA